MTSSQIAVLGASVGVTLFTFGPGWVRALVARVRPEPLASYRMPYGEAVES